MARTRKRASSSTSGVNSGMVAIAVLSILVGFIAGFLVARNRYTDKINVISQMNMEKAVTIDSLNRQLDVLGASTKDGK